MLKHENRGNNFTLLWSRVLHNRFLTKSKLLHDIILLTNTMRSDIFTPVFFLTGFYSPYRTLAFLNGLLNPQTFGRTPWLGDQSNTRPLPKHRTTQHRNTQTHIHAPGRIRTCDLNVQVVVDSTCLRLLSYWEWHTGIYWFNFTHS
jgi:hypothetical protein